MAMSEKNKQGLLVGGILGVAILAIVLYFMFMYVEPGIKKFKDETETLESKIAANKQKLEEYQSYLNNEEARRQVQEKFATIAKRLPDTQDTIEVYDLLRSYFEGSNVVFNALNPGASANRGRYTEFPFSIAGSAEYHAFGQLVNLIECNPDRLMHVTNLKLTNSDKRPSIHPMEVGVATFTFNANVPAPAAASTTK